MYVIKGEHLRVAFVEENGGEGAVVNDISQGDVTFFPESLIHYQQNLDCEPATYLSALNSEDPGVVTIMTRFFELPSEAIQVFRWRMTLTLCLPASRTSSVELSNLVGDHFSRLGTPH